MANTRSRAAKSDARLAREVNQLLRVIEAARPARRRDGDELLPLGEKAARTRQRLLLAASREFLLNGYLSTSVQDIHDRAGVSLGAFYQYFRDKADVMGVLVSDAIVNMAPTVFVSLDLAGGEESVREVIGAFVSHYADTAEFQKLWEEVTHVDPELAQLRRAVGGLIELSCRRAIERGQQAGHVDNALDAASTSRALAAMVDRYCYLTYVVGPAVDAPSVNDVVDALTTLWVNALRLQSPTNQRR